MVTPNYFIDIIDKTVKPSHLEKLCIMQNINKLMYQVILYFLILILDFDKANHSFLHPFCPGMHFLGM